MDSNPLAAIEAKVSRKTISPNVPHRIEDEYPQEIYDIADLQRTIYQRRIQFLLKDYFDRTTALALIIFLSPVFIAAAIAVKLTSPGPALFKQKRRGVNGDAFDCYKFRSMIVDQNSIASDSNIEFEPEGMLIKIKDDPRVTNIGKMLRKTSIDELPHLFNVLKGDMSFVGPRPLPLYNIDPHPEFRQLRGLVKPGITGIWQISARSNQNLTALSMQPYDLEYIRTFSFLLDMKILLKTIPAVLSGKGAE